MAEVLVLIQNNGWRAFENGVDLPNLLVLILWQQMIIDWIFQYHLMERVIHA